MNGKRSVFYEKTKKNLPLSFHPRSSFLGSLWARGERKGAKSSIKKGIASLSGSLLGDTNWASNHGILLYCEQNWAYVWRKGKKVKVMQTVVTDCSFY